MQYLGGEMVSQAQPQEYPFVDESFDTQSDSFVQSGINENALKTFLDRIFRRDFLKPTLCFLKSSKIMFLLSF